MIRERFAYNANQSQGPQVRRGQMRAVGSKYAPLDDAESDPVTIRGAPVGGTEPQFSRLASDRHGRVTASKDVGRHGFAYSATRDCP